MTLEKEQLLADLAPLAPEAKIKLHVYLLEEMIPVFADIVDDVEPFQRFIDVLNFCVTTGRRWLSGELDDPDDVLRPLEGPRSPRLADRELDHEQSRHFPDVQVLTLLGQHAIWYAAEIQFDRIGDEEVPQSLEERFTDEELAGLLAPRLAKASSRMKREFDAAWERRIRPEAGA